MSALKKIGQSVKSSYRSVDPQTLHGNVDQVDHVPNGPTNSAAITTMFPLRLCGGKLLVAVTRERRYGPSRLRVNDDDDYYDTERRYTGDITVRRSSLTSWNGRVRRQDHVPCAAAAAATNSPSSRLHRRVFFTGAFDGPGNSAPISVTELN